MYISFLGTRGIPASYSGFETCVEQLGQRLVDRGHEVTVYCRSHHITYLGTHYKGMRLIMLPTIKNKYLDTIVHSFISSIHALFSRYDVALYFIVGNSLVSWIPRLVGTKTALNVDGLDWKREKWPTPAKKYIQFAEYLATKLPTTYLTDSHVVQEYYRERFNNVPLYIPYGSEVDFVQPGETLARFNLEQRKYVLFVGRLEPENCVHHLIDAFRQLDTNMKCVIVGDAAYADQYIASLKAAAQDDPRIVFTGYVFGKGYHELGSNAYIFVESSGASGTHPALLEGMAFGNCVIAHNTAENQETVGDAGFIYDGKNGAADLARVLKELIENPDHVKRFRMKAKQRAGRLYSWETVTDAYERLCFRLIGDSLPERLVQREWDVYDD
jgi:glycosyltransferase involved in cell wall biosynthesis